MDRLIDNRFQPPIVSDDEYYKRISHSTSIIRQIERLNKPSPKRIRISKGTIVSPERVEDYVYGVFKVNNRKGRERPIPQCKAIISMLLHQQHGWGVSEISRHLNIHHATALYHLKRMNPDSLPFDDILNPMVKDIRRRLGITEVFQYRPYSQ